MKETGKPLEMNFVFNSCLFHDEVNTALHVSM